MLAVILNYIPAIWKWGAAALIVFALSGLYLSHRNQIYQDGFRTAQEACEREKEAQRQANEAAIRRAEKDLFEAADRLSMKSKEYDDALKALDEASAADPDGTNCGLGPRSLQRLNQIVGYGPNPAP